MARSLSSIYFAFKYQKIAMEVIMKINELGVLSTSNFYSHIPSEFSKKYLFTIHFAGLYNCNTDYIIERTFHDYYLILRVIDGQIQLEFDHHTFTANSNDLILFDCRIPHKYYATTNTTFELIHFKGNVSKELYENIISRYGFIISILNNIDIVKSIDTTIKMLEQNETNDYKISYEIHRILSILMEENHHSISSSDEALKKVLQFIDGNYWKQINLDDLANIALLSVYHFSRKFKEFSGMSPHKYLILQKLNNSKSLLKNTTFSINKISDMIGFNTPSHFISTFKKHTNMTPHEFRNFRF